jgi:PAS domain S-box-containing protein
VAALPFSVAFEDHPVIERTLRVRRNPIAAYGVAVAAVAVATLVRWLVGGQVLEGLPFITFYPAIIIATLAGGFWPGIAAIVLSTAAALYLFLPPLFGPDLNQREAVSLLLFVFMSGINATIVALLDVPVRRIMAQVQKFRVLFESAPTGIVVVDKRGVITLVNNSTEKQFGYDRLDLVGQRIEVLVPVAQVAQHREDREAFLQKPEARVMGAGRDLRGRRKDGSEFPIEIGLNPVGRNGRTAVLATIIDISDRKKALASQELIIRELQHRTQNLFAVFQAIAGRTIDENKTAEEIKYVLNGRVQALAHAYALIGEAAWEGASLAAILDREFAGFSGQVDIAGCAIVVSPSAAQQFALIIHELATNALKYGALSAPDGRVSIEGKIVRVDGSGTFSFVWRETGGPPVTRPTRKGFGSVILLDLARQFGENAVLDYAPQGLRYEVQLQLGAIEASKPLAKPEMSATLSEARAGNSVTATALP